MTKQTIHNLSGTQRSHTMPYLLTRLRVYQRVNTYSIKSIADNTPVDENTSLICLASIHQQSHQPPARLHMVRRIKRQAPVTYAQATHRAQKSEEDGTCRAAKKALPPLSDHFPPFNDKIQIFLAARL